MVQKVRSHVTNEAVREVFSDRNVIVLFEPYNTINRNLDVIMPFSVCLCAVWDVPNNVFNLENQTMANIYCQHASAAVIVVDVTDSKALHDAEERIKTLKDGNERVSIMLFANQWSSMDRVFDEDDMDSFCERMHSFISWQKVQTESAREEVQNDSLSEFDASIKSMISAEIRHGSRTK